MESELILGFWLSAAGIGVVAGSLGLLILSVQLLKLIFKKEEKDEEEEDVGEKKTSSQRNPDDTGELLASAPPDEILAIVAVERHRRRMALGSRLKNNANHIYDNIENQE